jgi:hypothetical protein
MKQLNPYIISICTQIEVKLGFKIKNIGAAQRFTENTKQKKTPELLLFL